MNKALDEIRAGESRRIATEGGVPVLKKSRWLLLKREENLKTEQRHKEAIPVIRLGLPRKIAEEFQGHRWNS
jgi:hypothetical protein